MSKVDMDPLFHIALYHPEIPPNTGNIGRLCLGIQAGLHIVHPIAFSMDEKQVRRAGLDYWPRLDYQVHKSIPKNPTGRVLAFTTKGDTSLWDVGFEKGDFLLFGREDIGLPDLAKEEADLKIRIPMIPNERSLNLAMSVSIASYEAMRQLSEKEELNHV